MNDLCVGCQKQNGLFAFIVLRSKRRTSQKAKNRSAKNVNDLFFANTSNTDSIEITNAINRIKRLELETVFNVHFLIRIFCFISSSRFLSTPIVSLHGASNLTALRIRFRQNMNNYNPHFTFQHSITKKELKGEV